VAVGGATSTPNFQSQILSTQAKAAQPADSTAVQLGDGGAPTSIEALAAKAGTDVNVLKKLNPALAKLTDAEFRKLPHSLKVFIPNTGKNNQDNTKLFAPKAATGQQVTQAAAGSSTVVEPPKNKPGPAINVPAPPAAQPPPAKPPPTAQPPPAAQPPAAAAPPAAPPQTVEQKKQHIKDLALTLRGNTDPATRAKNAQEIIKSLENDPDISELDLPSGMSEDSVRHALQEAKTTIAGGTADATKKGLDLSKKLDQLRANNLSPADANDLKQKLEQAVTDGKLQWGYGTTGAQIDKKQFEDLIKNAPQQYAQNQLNQVRDTIGKDVNKADGMLANLQKTLGNDFEKLGGSQLKDVQAQIQAQHLKDGVSTLVGNGNISYADAKKLQANVNGDKDLKQEHHTGFGLSGFDSWKVVGSTPQEISDGVLRAGIRGLLHNNINQADAAELLGRLKGMPLTQLENFLKDDKGQPLSIAQLEALASKAHA
jgi:hypothetical protein